jgi:hypothetical protein
MADRDPRAEELSKLKLALAIFSMLDVFEVRVRAALRPGQGLKSPYSLTAVSQSEPYTSKFCARQRGGSFKTVDCRLPLCRQKTAPTEVR